MGMIEREGGDMEVDEERGGAGDQCDQEEERGSDGKRRQLEAMSKRGGVEERE